MKKKKKMNEIVRSVYNESVYYTVYILFCTKVNFTRVLKNRKSNAESRVRIGFSWIFLTKYGFFFLFFSRFQMRRRTYRNARKLLNLWVWPRCVLSLYSQSCVHDFSLDISNTTCTHTTILPMTIVKLIMFLTQHSSEPVFDLNDSVLNKITLFILLSRFLIDKSGLPVVPKLIGFSLSSYRFHVLCCENVLRIQICKFYHELWKRIYWVCVQVS